MLNLEESLFCMQICAYPLRQVLPQMMEFCHQILMDPSADPRRKDGALHCVGALAELMLKVDMLTDIIPHVFAVEQLLWNSSGVYI